MDPGIQDWVLFGNGASYYSTTGKSSVLAAYDRHALRCNDDDEQNKVQCIQFHSAMNSLDMNKPIVFDRGATMSSSLDPDDFTRWDQEIDLAQVQLQGITGPATVAGIGRVHWNLRDDKQSLHLIQTTAYHVPCRPIWLFSPQAYFRQPKIVGKGGQFVVSDKACYFQFPRLPTLKPGKHCLTFYMQQHHPLPVAFPDWRAQERLVTPKYDWLHGWSTDYINNANITVVDDGNIILDVHQKELLRWHFRFGHFNMEWIKSLCRESRSPEGVMYERILPVKANAKVSTCISPLCTACQLAKAHHRPEEAVVVKKVEEKDGGLKDGDLRPGQMVSTNKFVSQLGG
jgi:hypothetical protein